jgi:hypothetical protein
MRPLFDFRELPRHMGLPDERTSLPFRVELPFGEFGYRAVPC